MQHWKLIVQTEMSGLVYLNQGHLPLDHHSVAVCQTSLSRQCELNDTATEATPSYIPYSEGKGASNERAFLFYLFGALSGMGWTLFVTWLLR